MDQLVLDIGSAEAAPGDTVTVFGDGSLGLPTAVDWATHSRRTPLAITGALIGRVRRSYLGGQE
jgi:alanine racemase